MKALLPGAVFIGFTGTPLLKQDKATSNEIFGNYIHTYKFGEAVEDGVVLDLLYEARDIPQELAATTKIDQWFEAKTKGLNDWQKAELRKQWGTMQKVLSSRSRMANAGYTPAEASQVEQELEYAVALRDTIRHASGETLDLKAYEADMRHLIDTYIEADDARRISEFDGIGLLDLIVKSGVATAVNELPPGIKKDTGAVAETIANNVRSKIIREKLNDPAFYESMSALLNDVLADLRANRISYEEFLQKIADLATKVQSGTADSTPKTLDTPGKRALFNNLGQDEALALRIDAEVLRVRPDGFRGNQAKENIIQFALLPLLGGDATEVQRVFSIIKAQPEY